MSENGKETGAELDRLLEAVPRWASGEGARAEVILSSRVRLARNLASVPFPARSTPQQQAAVVQRTRRAGAGVEALTEARYVDVSQAPTGGLELLVERRLVSRDLARGNRARGVLVGPGEAITVMINEEDHLRLQSVRPGLALGEALDALSGLDDALDAHLDYAFDPDLGYLTACPTNVGTGMRASVLAHLPSLVLTKRAKKVGLAVRGFYGEGTGVMGNFFQISNQTTLGANENEIVSRLDDVVRHIIGYETEAREVMWRSAHVQIEDKVYRAFGTLRSARSISAEEVVSLASAVRFGAALELPGLCSLGVLNEILILSQAGHLGWRARRELDRDERRELRARYVRERLDEAQPTGSSDRPAGGH
jgi:protein arginine kinase